MPRFILVTVASPATMGSLACQFLEKLGVDNVSDRTKVYKLWSMVRVRLQCVGITLVILDEAHDMFGPTSPAETDNMCHMLKSLMQGDHTVVRPLAGTERLRAITRQDEQVNRRFRKIAPPPLDIVADCPLLRKLMESYARMAGLSLYIRADDPDRLIHGGCYRLGRLLENIIPAIEEALKAGAEFNPKSTRVKKAA